MGRDSFGEGVVDAGEGGSDGGLGAQDELAERSFAETRGLRGSKFGIGPAAFGTDGEDGLPAAWLGLEDLTKGQGVGAFGEEDFYGLGAGAKGLRRLRQLSQNRNADAARLLRGFGENFLPALGALPCSGEQGLFAARGGEWHDGAHAKFGGLLDGPLEGFKFHNAKKQGDIDRWEMRGNFLEQREVYAIARDLFDASETDALAIAQFIMLARLRAQHSAEVMGGVAFNRRGVACELFNEKASPHAGDSSARVTKHVCAKGLRP